MAATLRAASTIALTLLAAAPSFGEPTPPATPSNGAPPPAVTVALGVGTSVLHEPSRLHGVSPAGLAVGAAVDLPLPRGGWALSLQAEHIERGDSHEDPVFAGDSVPDTSGIFVGFPHTSLSFRATIATVGLRWRGERTRVIPTLRAGIGWGRTSGFGYVTEFDSLGNSKRIVLTQPFRGMAPAEGFAYSACFGLEKPIRPTTRVYAEGGVLGLRARGEWIVVFPIRVGVALR